jgi:hypothetical protein
MKKYLVVLLLSFLTLPLFAAESNVISAMDDTWQTFRANHPIGYQTVGLRRYGDDCIFVISEPTETVSPEAIENLFKRYGGTSATKQKEFGYDGWLSDVVGQVRFTDKKQEDSFTHDLFTLLYGTDYKAFYTDLDNPDRHVFYSPYQLNYSVTAAELSTWFIDDDELLKDELGKTGNILTWIGASMQQSNKLLFSVEDGFVVWLINTNKIKANDKLFRTNARKFALDSDLIIGAFGKKGSNVAIVARERQVPVSVLPPLRIETLTLLATTTNQNLAQSYERYNVFAGKLKGNRDFAPIYLSDELWHTEYGNLLNITDQMLKSWSENGSIDYYEFYYPKPIDWAFNKGALEDLESTQLTYNWNTKGAGYVLEGDYTIYAINRTGSLPVSYFPDGMEGRVEEKVYDAEELAYDFFSQLNNPELVRVVQYAAFYQILTYFKNQPADNKSSIKYSSVPNYRVFDKYVEDILHLVDNGTDIHESSQYQSGFERFKKKYQEANDVTELLGEYTKNDPYGEFPDYLEEQLPIEELVELVYGVSDSEMEALYQQYIDTNTYIIRQYIENYEQSYGDFPFAEAAKYIVSPRELSVQVDLLKRQELKTSVIIYDSLVDVYYNNLEKIDEESRTLGPKLGILDAPMPFHSLTIFGDSDDERSEDLYDIVYDRLQKIHDRYIPILHSQYHSAIEALIKKWNNNEALSKRLVAMQQKITKEYESFERKSMRLMALNVDDKQQQAMGALNWLLTDTSPYDEPSGPFFATKLPQHNQWSKSPSMACSFNGVGYGGHNLDAHVTPIKPSTNVPMGKCRVSFQNGNRVISVAKADMKNVTPEVLRQVERQITEDGKLINLPPAPPTQPKTMLMPIGEKRTERGFSKAFIKEPKTIQQAITIDGTNIKTDKEFVDLEVAKSSESQASSQQIRIKPYTERQAIVEIEGEQKIVERTGSLSYDLKDYSPNVEEELRDGNGVIILHRKAETIPTQSYKAARLEIICPPEIVPDVKKSVQGIIVNPDINVDNQFKILRTIKMDLKQNQKFNGGGIRLENVIITRIFNHNSHNRYEQYKSSRIAA